MKPRGKDMVRLCQSIARDMGDGASKDRLDEQREMFIGLANEGDFGSRLPSFRVITPVAAAILAGLLSVLFWPDDKGMTFWVGPEQVVGRAGDWIEAPSSDTFGVSFDQGSRIILKRKSTARVASATAEEVAIDLSQGELEANIHGNARTEWHVDAGPFRVTVLGTVFTVAWQMDTKVLDVAVKRGVVLVQGAGLSEHGIKVEKGKHLRADSRTGFVSINDVDSSSYDPKQPSLLAMGNEKAAPVPKNSAGGGPRAGTAVTERNSDSRLTSPYKVNPVGQSGLPSREEVGGGTSTKLQVASDSSVGATLPATSRHQDIESAKGDQTIPREVFREIDPIQGNVETENDSINLTESKESGTQKLDNMEWLSFYRQGHYATAVARAEAVGYQSLINSLDQANLWKLIDATRSAGRVPLSLRALRTYRKRFPDTRKARVAAFLLGKTHSDQLHDQSRAVKWFKTYLAEDPNGPLAEEALGRLFRLCNNLSRTEEAQSAAKEYLQKYPNGSFSNSARAIQDGL